MPYKHIIYEKEDWLAILTFNFNRPEVRNYNCPSQGSPEGICPSGGAFWGYPPETLPGRVGEKDKRCILLCGGEARRGKWHPVVPP